MDRNYPEGINQHDIDPRSPEYIEPLTEAEKEAKYEAEISAYEDDKTFGDK